MVLWKVLNDTRLISVVWLQASAIGLFNKFQAGLLFALYPLKDINKY